MLGEGKSGHMPWVSPLGLTKQELEHVLGIKKWQLQGVGQDLYFLPPLQLGGPIFTSCPILRNLYLGHCIWMQICDVIKQNQSELRNINFKTEPNKTENVFYFLSFLASFNRSYLWNQLTNFNGVFCKM